MIHILLVVVGIVLIVLGAYWVFWWYLMSTLFDGPPNGRTFAIWGIAALGAVPVGAGILLVMQ